MYVTDLGSLDEFTLCSLHIVRLPSPCSKHCYLQGTSITEGEGPGFLATVLVDSIKVDRSFLFRLPTRQKCDT
ncbi:hypothetical protein L798_01106 [Zootermopsis nevadensis]|uniref:Uncharacterized protein n=1 Tax=Zootermopsis nevadensis TaxID=136037 RepID=A0A067QU71_ZOONE|nr:hypothetical protein L798_01106 [Zootermopsis nevadensis]